MSSSICIRDYLITWFLFESVSISIRSNTVDASDIPRSNIANIPPFIYHQKERITCLNVVQSYLNPKCSIHLPAELRKKKCSDLDEKPLHRSTIPQFFFKFKHSAGKWTIKTPSNFQVWFTCIFECGVQLDWASHFLDDTWKPSTLLQTWTQCTKNWRSWQVSCPKKSSARWFKLQSNLIAKLEVTFPTNQPFKRPTNHHPKKVT